MAGVLFGPGRVHETGRKYNPPAVEPLLLEEYRQLRDTIRARGSLRVVLFVATMVTWAVVAVLEAAFISLPLASLLSLILLMSGFEAVHQLHIAVERIGRYLYVRYENDSARTAGSAIHAPLMWEGAIAAFGAGHRASTRPADAMFTLMFALAITVNFLVAALGATPAELAGIGAVHALALARVLIAKRTAAAQRAEDQQRFEIVLR